LKFMVGSAHPTKSPEIYVSFVPELTEGGIKTRPYRVVNNIFLMKEKYWGKKGRRFGVTPRSLPL
jgi:hypothetical protein